MFHLDLKCIGSKFASYVKKLSLWKSSAYMEKLSYIRKVQHYIEKTMIHALSSSVYFRDYYINEVLAHLA